MACACLHHIRGCPDTAEVHYWSILNAPHGGATTIDGKKMPALVLEFFEAVEFAQPAHLPGVKPDIWEDPGRLAPMICGAVVLFCFCCIFCGFCRSGGGRSGSRPFLGSR